MPIEDWRLQLSISRWVDNCRGVCTLEGIPNWNLSHFFHSFFSLCCCNQFPEYNIWNYIWARKIHFKLGIEIELKRRKQKKDETAEVHHLALHVCLSSSVDFQLERIQYHHHIGRSWRAHTRRMANNMWESMKNFWKWLIFFNLNKKHCSIEYMNICTVDLPMGWNFKFHNSGPAHTQYLIMTMKTIHPILSLKIDSEWLVE